MKKFIEVIQTNGFEPYFRSNKLIGVKGIKKYRLKTLGISLERFKEIDKGAALDK